MKIIGKNEDIINILLKKHQILDSEIKKINLFYEQEILCLEIDFLLIKIDPFCSYVRLKFIDLNKFDLYISGRAMDYLERYKFLKMPDGYFYFSIDPYDETTQPHEKDNGVFHAKKVTGYCFNEHKTYDNA